MRVLVYVRFNVLVPVKQDKQRKRRNEQEVVLPLEDADEASHVKTSPVKTPHAATKVIGDGAALPGAPSIGDADQQP